MPSTIVRTEDERWRMEKGNLIAYYLLESTIGAYIEWLVNEPMRLLNVDAGPTGYSAREREDLV